MSSGVPILDDNGDELLDDGGDVRVSDETNCALIRGYTCADPPVATTYWFRVADVDLAKIYKVEDTCVQLIGPPICCPVPDGHTLVEEPGDAYDDCSTCLNFPACVGVYNCSGNGFIGYIDLTQYPNSKYLGGVWKAGEQCFYITSVESCPVFGEEEGEEESLDPTSWLGPFASCEVCYRPCCPDEPPTTVSFSGSYPWDDITTKCPAPGELFELLNDPWMFGGVAAIPGPPTTTVSYNFTGTANAIIHETNCDDPGKYQADTIVVAVTAFWFQQYRGELIGYVWCLNAVIVRIYIGASLISNPGGLEAGGHQIAMRSFQCFGAHELVPTSDFIGNFGTTGSITIG